MFFLVLLLSTCIGLASLARILRSVLHYFSAVNNLSIIRPEPAGFRQQSSVCLGYCIYTAWCWHLHTPANGRREQVAETLGGQ